MPPRRHFVTIRFANVESRSSVQAAAALLRRGGPNCVNSAGADGLTCLHRLAAAGMADCLSAFLAAAGDAVDLLPRTKAGLNALQLARQGKHAAVCRLLEESTEAAAAAAQVIFGFVHLHIAVTTAAQVQDGVC